MARSRARMKINTDSLINNLSKLDSDTEQRIGVIAERQATVSQNEMRSNAPWQDRTGNARNGLFGKYSREGDTHKITLSHSMNYGIWLETRWAGKYEIIRPSISKGGDDVMRQLGRLFNA